MTSDLSQHLNHMSADELRPIVAQILDREADPIAPWSVAEIGRSAGTATAGLFIIAGSASTSIGVLPWSVAVKVLGPPRLQLRQFDAVAAARELAVYRSDALTSQAHGVRAPRCYAIRAWNDLHFVWLEDLSDAPQPPWIPEYYIQAAQDAGQFNGRWSGPALPDWEWLWPVPFRTHYLSPRHTRVFATLPALQSDPVVGRALPTDVIRDLVQLWEESDELLSKAEETSPCLCHGDYKVPNLFPMLESGQNSYTIAVDWAGVGIGHMGIDIGKLLGYSVKWLALSPDEAEALVEPIFEAYLTDLMEAGWTGNYQQLQLTYLTCLGTCEAILAVNLLAVAVEHPDSHGFFEEMMRCPIDEGFERWAEALRFFLIIHDRALQLARRL